MKTGPKMVMLNYFPTPPQSNFKIKFSCKIKQHIMFIFLGKFIFVHLENKHFSQLSQACCRAQGRSELARLLLFLFKITSTFLFNHASSPRAKWSTVVCTEVSSNKWPAGSPCTFAFSIPVNQLLSRELKSQGTSQFTMTQMQTQEAEAAFAGI